MAKQILSGDLGVFRIEMVIRILEAIKFDGGVALDGLEGAQLFMEQGKIVGAQTSGEQGLAAILAISGHRTGNFTVHQADAAMLPRHPELEPMADNAAVFRAVAGLAAQVRVATVPKPDAPPVYPLPRATAAPDAPPGAAGRPPGPMGPPPVGAQIQRAKPANAGPMARIPELTDRARLALRSIQTNAVIPGTGIDSHAMKFLQRVDSLKSLKQIAEELGLVGPEFNEVAEHLFKEGYIRFQALDPGGGEAKAPSPTASTKFRFGEYLVSRGIITETQLESALRRQQEVARRGRYQWLGEILLELQYIKPVHVQEALAIQKRQQG